MVSLQQHQATAVAPGPFSILQAAWAAVGAATRRSRPLVLPALLALLSGCTTGGTTLTVPVSQWPGYEYFPLARQRGLDLREGIRLELPAYANPQDIVHAYLRGDIQLAQLTTVEAVDLCSRVPKRCPVVILVLDESRGGDQVVVDRQIMDPQQTLQSDSIVLVELMVHLPYTVAYKVLLVATVSMSLLQTQHLMQVVVEVLVV